MKLYVQKNLIFLTVVYFSSGGERLCEPAHYTCRVCSDFSRCRPAMKMEELGISMEWCMVKEMGHVAYLLNVTQSKEGMRKLIEELQTYPYANLNEPNARRTEEELVAFQESNIEKDGDIWGNAFAQRYYPDKTLSNLALIFEAIKNEDHSEPKSD